MIETFDEITKTFHIENSFKLAIKLQKLTEDEKFILYVGIYISRTHTIPTTNPLCIIHYTTIQYSKKKQIK